MSSATNAWLAVLLFTGAIIGALLFSGIRIECFTTSLVLLHLWLVCVLWQNYTHGLHVPKTALTLSLSLFWLWLGLSLLWHPAPLIGINYFWIVGSLPLVFWIYTLAQDQRRLWQFFSGAALLTGAVLAVWALYQVFLQHGAPRSVFLDINSHAAFLNLIALPAAAYFLIRHPGNHGTKILGALLFLLFLAIMLTKGRGAIASFIIGLGILLWATKNDAPKKLRQILFLLAAYAFLLADLSLGGGVIARLQMLGDDPARLLIWQQAWEMLKHAPWLGTGIGTFWLAWPPWRDPADISGGYYAHNDYLQLWIEAGLPGLVLLLAVLGAVLWLFLRVLKNARTTPETRVEITGLFSGLLAIAAHSFLNFNLYVMPTLMLAGIVLGRFHQLAAGVLGADRLSPRPITWYPVMWLGKRAYFTMVALLALFPLGYFATQAASDYYYQQALRLSTEGKMEAVNSSLRRAARLSPLADNVLNTYADFFRHLLAALPEAADKDRKALYAASLELLDKAHRLNTLRAQVFFTRGQIYQQNPDLTGEHWFEQAAAEYQTALRLDPRLYKVRVAYAQLLLSRSKTLEAKRLLEAGIRHYYLETPDILQYYEFTRRAYQLAGETARARQIEIRVDGILKNLNMKRVVAPAASAPQISGPYAKPGVSLN